jgi:hypothetical protein
MFTSVGDETATFIVYSEDSDSLFFQNACNHIRDYTVS